MSAKRGNSANKVKELCLYALFSALCLGLSFLESLLPLDFIAPGVKLGLANTVCVILVLKHRLKGAFAVNAVRIILAAVLFGSPVSFVFSFAAGVVSLSFTCLMMKVKALSTAAVSCAAGVVHNAVQTAVGLFFVGRGVLFYLPLLVITGGVSGLLVGIISTLISKKIKTNPIF